MPQRQSILASVILLGSLFLAACSEKPPHDPRTAVPLVKTAMVKPASSSASRAFTGTVAARVQSDLAFRVSGKVLERYVDAGQKVKLGQALLRIDANDLLLSVKGQQETVQAAKVRADQTAQEELRHRGLVEAGAISSSTYDQIKAAAEAAQAQLKATESQAGVAKNASTYATLLADSDGVVVETLAEPGQVVNAGQTVIRIAHAGEREAIVNLPGTLHPPLGTKATATLYGKEDQQSSAKLRQLSESADALTRTYEARFTLADALVNARLGATVIIQMKEDEADQHDTFEVPVGALLDRGKATGVWWVDGKSSQVHWRPVTLVHLGEEKAIVKGNLKPSDEIVALGAHLLRDGEKIRVLKAAKPDATSSRGEQ
jgi:RND family efflux transporter MFP subunit